MTKKIVTMLIVVVLIISAYVLGTMQKSSLVPEIPRIPDIPGIVGEKEIDLSGKNLTSFPKDILSQTQATKLVLSNNKLKTLPSEIGQLANLEELYLDHNLLEGSLPGEIRKMSNLKILDVQNNNMTGIPAEIGQLRNLSTLNYSYNSLDTYPNEIGNLKNNLKTLNISDNKYSQDSIDALKRILPNTNIITK